MILISNAKAVAKGFSVPFSGIGGTSPYTYQVLSGSAVGTIDASTGLYTADGNYGTDIIRVTDADDETADLPIAVLTYIELVADIIQTELGLANGRVMLFDQKWDMPKDPYLFITIQQMPIKIFGNSTRNTTPEEDTPYLTVQSINVQSQLSIDIMSQNIDALNRKEEVAMALVSDYAERQQNLNSFYIAPIPNIIPLNDIDGSSIPYRFNITATIQYAMEKSVTPEYYDSFPGVTVVPDELVDDV